MKKPKKVQTKFRTNVLSHIPGGCVIILTYKNGDSLIYDKIKHPKKYLERALENPNITTAYLNNEVVWTMELPKKRNLIPLQQKVA